CLYIGPGTDLDPINVTPDYRIEPNAGALPDGDLTDDMGARRDKNIFSELRAFAVVLDHRRHRKDLREGSLPRPPEDRRRSIGAREQNIGGIHRCTRK